MKMIKKLVVLASLLSISTITNAGVAYMIVQCNMNPAATVSASYSDPNTGLPMTAPSCGEALTKVPVDFYIAQSSAAGTTSAAFVTYLFGKQTVPLTKTSK